MGILRGNAQFFGGSVGYVTMRVVKQEAQLPQRNSASAAHMEGGWG